MAESLAVILMLGLPARRILKVKITGFVRNVNIRCSYWISWAKFTAGGYAAYINRFKNYCLIIILLRAGLGLNKNDLKAVGINALKMKRIPGLIEGFFIALASMYFLNFTFAQGGMLGFIIAAVSPAVVVPSMVKLMERKVGTNKGVPTLILADASIDDVFAITIFSAFRLIQWL